MHHMHRHIVLITLMSLFVGWFGGAPALAQTTERCFAETGYCIDGPIRDFWEQQGGLPVFGLPIGPQQAEQIEGQTLQVQWFERNRLELHSEGVLLGRLGADALEQQGRNWYAFPKSEPQQGCRFFSETEQTICDPILSTWRAYGLELDGLPGTSEAESLALFGLPISPVQAETIEGQTLQVQWFERARFEIHAEGVLLGLLGRELQTGQSVPAPAPAPGAAPAPGFEYGACPFAALGVLNADCGYLTVPEDRSQPGGRMLRLAVAIIHSPGNPPSPEPVVYLAGGPGGYAIKNAPSLFLLFRPFLEGRDLIIFDQRGVGVSEPALECPEYRQLLYDTLDAELSAAAAVEAEMGALLRCRDRLVQEGATLAAYTSAANAADLNDLRQALGYEQWNLLGVSYGTRLALTTMRDYPEGIRSVILDSTFPPQVNLYVDLPANINRAFEMLFRGCAANQACNLAYPNLETTFYQLVSRLDADPITVPVVSPITGNTEQVLVDGRRLIELVFVMLYNKDTIALLPGTIVATSQGNYTSLALLLSIQVGLIEESSIGMHYAIQCGDEVGFIAPDQLRAAVAAYPQLQPYLQGNVIFTDALFELCSAWGARPPAPLENEPVWSDIPTLVLAGEYDPITPPVWGQMAADTLGNSYFYAFPNQGHGVSVGGNCPVSVIKDFLAVPTQPPDASCIDQLGGPPFVTLPF